MRLCTFPGCGRKHRAKGYCYTHWRQHQRGVPCTPIGHWYAYRNTVLGRRLDARLSAALENAALRYANAEGDAEFEHVRRRLLTCALAIAWKSRRAVPPAHPSPAQGPEAVSSACPGPSSTERAA